MNSKDKFHTSFWQEVAEPNNPFFPRICRCSGYDVYGDLLGKISWIDYLFLLFHRELPSDQDSQILNHIAVAIANPGPRDYSVQGAMSAGAGGSTLASCLMAALAIGAGTLGGAHEVYEAIKLWVQCGQNRNNWISQLSKWHKDSFHSQNRSDIWHVMEHPPGFDPYKKKCSIPVQQTIDYLSQFKKSGNLTWLRQEQHILEATTQRSLSLSGVAAATFTDLGFDPQQGEMLYLLLRLPGAAAHGLEQHWKGYRDFPFYQHGIQLTNDPGPISKV